MSGIVEIKGIIDLAGVIMSNVQELGTIGTTLFTGSMGLINQLDIPLRNWQIYGQASDLLKVKQDNVLGIFLTYAPQDEPVEYRVRSKKLAEPELTYIKEHLIDYLVIRHRNGPVSDPKLVLTTLFQLHNVEFITDADNDVSSLSYCGAPVLSIPMDFHSYKHGVRSPGKLFSYICLMAFLHYIFLL